MHAFGETQLATLVFQRLTILTLAIYIHMEIAHFIGNHRNGVQQEIVTFLGSKPSNGDDPFGFFAAVWVRSYRNHIRDAEHVLQSALQESLTVILGKCDNCLHAAIEPLP